MGRANGADTQVELARRDGSHLLHGEQPAVTTDESVAQLGRRQVTLEVAREGGGIPELRRVLAETSSLYAFFPEAFLTQADLEGACQAAREHGKWVLTGISEDGEDGKFLSAVVIGPEGQVCGSHRKTVLTEWERAAGYKQGDALELIEMDGIKVGVAICYEIHFPEVARIYALQGANVIFNPIGTGMWTEAQFDEWTTIARARAIENNLFVIGCSHANDEVPIAFAYGPTGEKLLEQGGRPGAALADLDFSKVPESERLTVRRPDLYGPLAS